MRRARPRLALCAKRLSSDSSSNCSICFSTSSDNLKPCGPNSLMPLSSNRLCEAEIITPRSAHHTSDLQSPAHLVFRPLLEKKKPNHGTTSTHPATDTEPPTS